MLSDENLSRTTIYFSHYLFETCTMLGRVDALFDRLGMWFDLEKLGFKTTFEEPEPSRSDCQAWGAHPLFHYFASILGIRPAVPGFSEVSVEPQLGPLSFAGGTLPHPNGVIRVEFKVDGGTVTGMIEVFDVMALSGTGNARSMASGVSKATIPTMAGMVGALSGVFLVTMLTRRVEREVELLEDDLTMDH